MTVVAAAERLRFRLDLLAGMIRRDVLGRYRGSMFGIGWSLASPLLMLAVFTIAFHELLGARWPGVEGRAGFATMVFVGLLLHGLVAEVLVRAPLAISGNTQLVKKMVFPLTVLPLVPVGSALVHALLGFFVLVVASLLGQGQPLHLTAFAAPLLLLPFIALLTGFAWTLAAVGVYVRDIAQLGGVVATVLLFLSPIFFPLATLPEPYRELAWLNPLTWVVEGVRGMLFSGVFPGWRSTVVYSTVSVLSAGFGIYVFRRLRPGFGDVL